LRQVQVIPDSTFRRRHATKGVNASFRTASPDIEDAMTDAAKPTLHQLSINETQRIVGGAVTGGKDDDVLGSDYGACIKGFSGNDSV